MGRISDEELLDLLNLYDEELDKQILVIAVGGTAMTLLKIKSSTKDIDFNIPYNDDFKEFTRVKNKIETDIKIDSWYSNLIFSEILPEDYIDLSIKYKTDFKNIDLRILNPIDIACSKISRLSDSDMSDIKSCIKYVNITKSQLIERASQYSRVGSDEVFELNLKYIIENIF